MRPSFLELNPKIPAFTSSFNVSTIEGTFFSFFFWWMELLLQITNAFCIVLVELTEFFIIADLDVEGGVTFSVTLYVGHLQCSIQEDRACAEVLL